MFEVPSMENVEEVVVNEEAVMTDAAPLMIYAKSAKKEVASAG
jgi:ATP-dependent Clp protease ATP-binding subunit ClpX